MDNETRTPREIDELNENIAIEARLNESRTTRPTEVEELKNDADEISENPIEQEVGLNSKQSEAQNKPAINDEIKDIAVKQVKKRIWLWILGGLASTAWIWVPALLIFFTIVFTYVYWTNHKWNPTIYWKVATEDYAGLLNNAINDTDAYGTTPAPAVTTPKSTETK